MNEHTKKSDPETGLRPSRPEVDERLRRAPGGPKGNKFRRTHARYELARLMTDLGSLPITSAIDRRTRLGRELADRRAALEEHLGEDRLTEPRRLIVEQIVRRLLFLESIDAWLFSLPSLVNRRKRCVIPALREREALASALTRDLQALGLDRVEKPVETLADWLEGKRHARRRERCS